MLTLGPDGLEVPRLERTVAWSDVTARLSALGDVACVEVPLALALSPSRSMTTIRPRDRTRTRSQSDTSSPLWKPCAAGTRIASTRASAASRNRCTMR